jgi:hypothetical protein
MAGSPLQFTSVLADRAALALRQAEVNNPEEIAAIRAAVAAPMEGRVIEDVVSPDAALCDCYVNQAMQLALEAQGVTLTSEMGAVLYANCVDNGPAAFAAQMDERGISYEGCKPWYARKVTMYVGGGALLLGLAWMVFR